MGWLDQYAEGGIVPGEEEKGKNPKTPPAKTPAVKTATAPAANVSIGKRYGELFYDMDDPLVKKALNKQAEKIHFNSNMSCTAGSLNCLTDLVQPALNSPSVRKMTEVHPEKYKIPSADIRGSGNYVPNQSLDAWEIHQQLTGEGQGTSVLNPSMKRTYKPGKELPNELDYKNLPIGTILGQGSSTDVYTSPEEGERNRHAVTIIGFDKKDGVPLIYDYGQVRRIDDNESGVDAGMHFTNVTIPKGYENYTKDNLSKMHSDYTKTLGYDPNKKTTVNYNSKKPYLQQIQKGVNEVKDQIGYDFGVPQTAINRMAMLVPGIANRETKIDNNEGTSAAYMFGENLVGNKMLKPLVKGAKNVATAATNLVKSEKSKQDYQLEIEAYKKFGNDSIKRDNYLRELKEKKGGKENYQELESSVGAFAIKNLPEYATKKLGITKDDISGVHADEDQRLNLGSKAALTHLAEDFSKLKKKYPDLTDDQLVDLSVVAYNNQGKVNDPEFVDYYIKNKVMKDNYLSEVKGYKIKQSGGSFLGTTDEGFNYNGAWGGQFQSGGRTHELDTNPNRLKGESEESWAHRQKYNAWRIRQEQNKHPLTKSYLEMKDKQNADPNLVTKTIRQVLTSPLHVAHGIYEQLNPYVDKYKSSTRNREDYIDLGSSVLDAGSLLTPFDVDTGLKSTAAPIWQQVRDRIAKQSLENIGEDAVKSINNAISFKSGGWLDQFQDGGILETPVERQDDWNLSNVNDMDNNWAGDNPFRGILGKRSLSEGKGRRSGTTTDVVAEVDPTVQKDNDREAHEIYDRFNNPDRSTGFFEYQPEDNYMDRYSEVFRRLEEQPEYEPEHQYEPEYQYESEEQYTPIQQKRKKLQAINKLKPYGIQSKLQDTESTPTGITDRYYNTDPRRGEVEQPAPGYRNIPISNSEELRRWEQQNTVPQFGNGGKTVGKPAPPKQNKPKTFSLEDKRKKSATTGKPIDPNVDLVGGQYDQQLVQDIIRSAKKYGINPYTALSIGLQETKFGKSDDNIGHVTGKHNTQRESSAVDDYMAILKDKMAYADKLGIKDEATRLQTYNGLGTITPQTESKYHGFDMQKIYGVPVPKQGINMRKNPLYGKRVMDLRDNVLRQDQDVLKMVTDISPEWNPVTGTYGQATPDPFGLNQGFAPAPTPQPREGLALAQVNKQFTKAQLAGLESGGSMPGSVGFSYAREGAPSNGPYARMTMASAQYGGIIDDDRGQWAHPGEVTRINSNRITMRGVHQPLMGISDVGDKKLMFPEHEYDFLGKNVTEYPIAKDGNQLTKLNQLTNFTNYNKKQPGGWLDQL